MAHRSAVHRARSDGQRYSCNYRATTTIITIRITMIKIITIQNMFVELPTECDRIRKYQYSSLLRRIENGLLLSSLIRWRNRVSYGSMEKSN